MIKRVIYLLVLLIQVPFVHAKETVNLTSGEWPPYLSVNLPHGGFGGHIVEEAFAAVGIDVNYGYYPWKRSYLYALDGEDFVKEKWHGTLAWVITEERQKHFYYSDPIIIDDEVLFSLKESAIEWEKIEDLQGMTIGGTAHTAYPVFEDAIERGIITLERGGNYNALLKRVFYKKIDATPLVKYVGIYYLTNSFNEEDARLFTHSPTVIETRKYHLILTKKHPENKELINRFNLGLKKIRENGLYQSLHEDLQKGVYNHPTVTD